MTTHTIHVTRDPATPKGFAGQGGPSIILTLNDQDGPFWGVKLSEQEALKLSKDLLRVLDDVPS